MSEPDDPRITNQAGYLTGAAFEWKRYHAPSATWNHDHCEFCWQRFAEPAEQYPDAVDWGYAALGTGHHGESDYHWVCQPCFHDFRDRFSWTVRDQARGA